MSKRKRKIIDDSTVINSEFLQPIFGGDASASQTAPEFAGHFHDVAPGTPGAEWGHAPKIDLTNHTTGRLTLSTDNAVLKNLSSPATAGVATSIVINTNTVTGLVWYFPVPPDMDVTQDPYFAFQWMGQMDVSTDTFPKNVSFRITWQWYLPGNSVFTPSTLQDAYGSSAPAGLNVIQNPLTSGRKTLNLAQVAYKLSVNDSITPNVLGAPNTTNGPNYVRLTGANAATNTTMLGVQVEVMQKEFDSVEFFQTNFYYVSRTLGGGLTVLPSF